MYRLVTRKEFFNTTLGSLTLEYMKESGSHLRVSGSHLRVSSIYLIYALFKPVPFKYIVIMFHNSGMLVVELVRKFAPLDSI